jgi:site-specific DNA-methyltransferase (adenine-specific)
MEYMASLPDKAFDLAIVDPPYGLTDKITIGGGIRKKYNRKYDWDNKTPNAEYFTEIKRVSKNQIIWGSNYFFEYLGNTRCVLIWDKIQEFSGSDFEMAWTSFDSPAKSFRLSRIEAYGKGVIHPTQKPVALYKWLLTNYTKQGDRILDTHLGSGSSAIAAHDYGFDFVGCELDKDYYDAAVKRFNNHKMQTKLF